MGLCPILFFKRFFKLFTLIYGMAEVEFNVDSKKTVVKPVAQPAVKPATKPVAKIAEPLQEVRIRRIGVISVANISALVSFIMMLFMVLIFLGVGSLIPPLTIPTTAGVPPMDVDSFISFSPLTMIIGAFFYAGFAWVSGAIGALLYNLAAKISKGVRLFA
jgi:hypothetical protein